jgi:hypothetical protein
MYLDGEIRQRFQDTQHSNSLLKNLAFRRLWVPKVHHLIQQLVDDNEVVPDGFFLHFLEVFSQNLK